MKRSIAKILVLVLIVTLLVPAAANAAANDTYKVTVTLTAPKGDETISMTKVYEHQTGTVKTLILTVAESHQEVMEKFKGTGLAASFDDLLASATGDNDQAWTIWLQDAGITGDALTLLSDRSTELYKVAELNSITAAFHGCTMTVAFEVENTAPYYPPVTQPSPSPSPSPSAAPAEENVVVDASDVTEGEPVVVEEAVEVADTAEEAAEIAIENIPEEVKELAVEVALEAAEGKEVAENSTVLAVKDKDGNVTIIPMAVVEVDEDGNITAKGSLNEELTEILKDGGSLIAYDNEQEQFEDVKAAVESGDITQDEADAVAYWQARGVVEGEGDGNLGGLDQEVGRTRFVTLLHRAFGAPAPEADADYADLDNEKYGYAKDAASWAAELGLMNGVGMNDDGAAEFGTGEIAQWQMALVMFRAVGGSDEYPYEAAWSWAVQNGLISNDRDASPDMPELCLIMQRFAELLNGEKITGDATLDTPALED